MPGITETGESDSIKVFVRVRPPCDEDRIELGHCLTVDTQRNAIIMKCKPEARVFTYDQIADINTTQEMVFECIGKSLIESCIAGYNGTIFAYGQTGSGKTFTMIGPSEDCDNFQHAQRGVIPHSFEKLFTLIKKEQLMYGEENVEFLCRCSFLEIYNEQIYDLLDPASTGLQLRENMKRGVFVDGLIERSVASACDAYQVLAAGWANRTVAATSMNRESSRSHAVFTLHIESKKKTENIWHVKSSQLNLVDLAGSERQKDTHTIGVRLKEAGSINRSLSALGNVIMALGGIAHGKSRHVPYRDSKLSFLLRDSLGGNAKTHMIACVHPGARCFGETLSTLQFASRAKLIKNKAVVNEDAHGSVPSLQAEIKRLKLALLQVSSGVSERDTSGVNEGDSTVSVPATKWKDCFLQAMLQREQTQEEAKVLRDNYTRLEQTCSRKDQALRQSRMVLKFREDALRRLEKAHKEKTDVAPDEKDAIIVALRNEVQTLQQLVDQPPDVTAYKLMADSLRSELDLAHRQCCHTVELTEQKARELEAAYRQLQTHSVHDASTRRSSVCTPRTEQESALSVATVERLKSQNTKLQTELESLRKELAAERSSSQRAQIEHEAQLVSLRRGRDELEKVLKSHQVHMQMERQARQEMHLKTLKTMTTPKKAKYNLRNRTVLVDASGNAQSHTPVIPRLNLDMSFGTTTTTTSDDEIMAETAPPEWISETLNALTDEIQQLQEENQYLRVQLESKEADTVHMVEQFSQLDSQKQQTQQLYEGDKAAWREKEEELQQTLNQLTKQVKDANFSAEVARDEVKDLWVMIGGLDRQVKETQQVEKSLKDTANSHTAALETKILQLEMEVARLEKESGELTEELTSLKEREETLQTTLDFNTEQQAELEQQLKARIAAVEQLEAQLKTTETSQQQAETKNQQLVSQLQQEAGKEDQLLAALQHVETLQSEIQSGRVAMTMLESEAKELQARVEMSSVEIDHLKKTNLEKQEALQSMSATLTEQKQRLQLTECQLESTTRQLDESVEHREALQTTCRTMEETLDRMRVEMETQQNTFEERLQKKDVEVELLNEDLQDQLDCNTAALHDLQTANQNIEHLTAQLAMIKQLSAASAEKDQETEAKEVDLKQKLDVTEAAHQAQIDDFNSVKDELMARIVELEQKVVEAEKANADMVSHQNLKQKIHYHVQLKEANIELTQKLKKVTDEATKYKQLYLKNTGKENVPS